jgi:hypothetical protein
MATILPEPGDFGAVEISGVVGGLISFGEMLYGSKGFTKWEHALVYIGDGKCLQAEPGGSAIVTRGVRPGDIWSTGVIDIPDATRAKVPALAESMKGIPYSGLDYVALAAHRLHVPDVPAWPGKTPWHPVTLQTYIGDTGHMICSQLVDEFEERLGIHLFVNPPRWPGYVTPWDIGTLLVSKGAKVIA